MHQPHRKPISHKSRVSGVVRPGAVWWRIGNVAVMPVTGWHNSTRYGGTWPCRQLNTMTLSLYTTCSGTSSQCSSVWRSHDKPRSNLWVSWPHTFSTKIWLKILSLCASMYVICYCILFFIVPYPTEEHHAFILVSEVMKLVLQSNRLLMGCSVQYAWGESNSLLLVL